MGFFSGNDKVTYKEFRKVIFRLKESGFSETEREEVASAFRGDLHESSSGAGISKEEMKKGLHWLKEHPGHHHLSPDQLVKLEETLRRYL
ncbi:MAG: hypothetical protein AAB511_01195 [Patescibacteria group bacterium]